MSSKIRHNWKSLAIEFDMDVRTLKVNTKSIKKQLDSCLGRSNYRNLTPKQVELIKKHLGFL